jgi:hypothetical protein
MNEIATDYGDSIVHAREKNLQHLPDDEYIRVLADDGDWVIVTTDIGMSRSPHLVRALASSGLVSVSLRHGWLEMGGWDIAWGLMRRWPKIKEMAVWALGRQSAGFSGCAPRSDCLSCTAGASHAP